MNLKYEIIFITNLNKDKTYDILKAHNENDQCLKTIKLSNSFGHHSAVVSGLESASGSKTINMDGDLQDYPEDIPKLYNKTNEGYDVVLGIKDKKMILS